jgi:hypothetical protein
MGVRITTWNVNGIRNPFSYQPWRDNRTFGAMFDILEADIVIMQELKIQRKDLKDDMVLVPGWDCYFSLPKHKKGGGLVHLLIILSNLTLFRVFWSRHIHSSVSLWSDSCGGRRPWGSLPTQLGDTVS